MNRFCNRAVAIFRNAAGVGQKRQAIHIANHHVSLIAIKKDETVVPSRCPPESIPLLWGQIVYYGLLHGMVGVILGSDPDTSGYGMNLVGPAFDENGVELPEDDYSNVPAYPVSPEDHPLLLQFLVANAELMAGLPLRGSIEVRYGRRTGTLQFQQLSLYDFQLNWSKELVRLAHHEGIAVDFATRNAS